MKASYKTELLYLWERWHGTIQELDKTRDQLTISEKRIETLITDSDERHSKIIEEHKHEINIAGFFPKKKIRPRTGPGRPPDRPYWRPY